MGRDRKRNPETICIFHGCEEIWNDMENLMATSRGVEPPTFPLGGECSIQLSYEVF